MQFESMYLSSEDGIAVHDRVDCGLFARFFHQAIFTWQTEGLVQASFARYHGKVFRPKAFTQYMYDNLIVQDQICRPENLIASTDGLYTLPQINALVKPISLEDLQFYRRCSVQVSYEKPAGFIEMLRRSYWQSHPPPVNNADHPVLLQTSHGVYVLISKKTALDSYVRSVRFF